MSDLNVALRLTLVNQMKSGAEAAKRELNQLRDTAKGVGKSQSGNMAAATRGARQLERAERSKVLAIDRTSTAYRRQRTELLAGSLAANRVERSREVRANREAIRQRRDSRAQQAAIAAAASRAGIEWMPTNRTFRSHPTARLQRNEQLAERLAAERAEARAVAKRAREAKASAAAGAGAAGLGASGVAASVGGGIAAKGSASGAAFARSFIGGMGIGIGVAGAANILKQTVIGAANDEWERDQLRVAGGISKAKMEEHRKLLDMTARQRGIGSEGSLGVFGGLMAGGLSDQDAASMTDGVVVFAKATKSSMDDATRSTVALRNNMKLVSRDDLFAAYDAIAVGGKVGEFEVQDMAQHLPSLLAKMQGVGEAGVRGVQHTVALAQAVRKVVGSSDEAATLMDNMLGTFTSSAFIKGASKMGINVEKTMKDANKNGLSPVFAMLHAIEKKTGGDPFKIAKLFPNKRAASAVMAILRDMGFVMGTLEEMASSAGTVMDDYAVATDNASEAYKRFMTNIGEGSKNIGASVLPLATAALNALSSDLENKGGNYDPQILENTPYNTRKEIYETNIRGARNNRTAERALGYAPSESTRRVDVLDAYEAYQNSRLPDAREIAPTDMAELRRKLGLGDDVSDELLQRVVKDYHEYQMPSSDEVKTSRRDRKRRADMETLKGELGLNAVERDDLIKQQEEAEAFRRANLGTPLQGIKPGPYRELSPDEIKTSARDEKRRADMEALKKELGLNSIDRDDLAQRDKEADEYRRNNLGAPRPASDDIPIPTSRPGSIFEQMLRGMDNPAKAASASMGDFNQALDTGLSDARSSIQAAVADFKSMLSFSAGPTIRPNIQSVAGAGVQQAAAGGNTVNVTQNISAPNSRLAARRSQREQNRQVDLALGNALHDRGLA